MWILGRHTKSSGWGYQGFGHLHPLLGVSRGIGIAPMGFSHSLRPKNGKIKVNQSNLGIHD